MASAADAVFFFQEIGALACICVLREEGRDAFFTFAESAAARDRVPDLILGNKALRFRQFRKVGMIFLSRQEQIPALLFQPVGMIEAEPQQVLVFRVSGVEHRILVGKLPHERGIFQRGRQFLRHRRKTARQIKRFQ